MQRTEWERGEPWEEPASDTRLAEKDGSLRPSAGYGTALMVAVVLVAIWALHACVPALAGS